MKIKQVRISSDISYFGSGLKIKFGLVDYHDRYTPSFFYGCYRKEDLEAILAHKSFAVVIWGGSDAMQNTFLNIIKNAIRKGDEKIFHIAPSSFIAEDLNRVGLDHLRINIYPKNDKKFRPEPLGSKVYMYASTNTDDRKSFYGLNYLNILQDQLPGTEFIIGYSNPSISTFEKMNEVYRECAVGVRLVPHDAGSCTVVELALMGRKCIWNGYFPSAIHYNSLSDVVSAIRFELNREGEMDKKLSEISRKAISDLRWLNLETFIGSQFSQYGVVL